MKWNRSRGCWSRTSRPCAGKSAKGSRMRGRVRRQRSVGSIIVCSTRHADRFVGTRPILSPPSRLFVLRPTLGLVCARAHLPHTQAHPLRLLAHAHAPPPVHSDDAATLGHFAGNWRRASTTGLFLTPRGTTLSVETVTSFASHRLVTSNCNNTNTNMSTKENNEVAVEKVTENDNKTDAKCEIKGFKRPAEVSPPNSSTLFFPSNTNYVSLIPTFSLHSHEHTCMRPNT